MVYQPPTHCILTSLLMVYRHPTHGILTPYLWYIDPLLMVYRAPYPWYISIGPPIHGIVAGSIYNGQGVIIDNLPMERIKGNHDLYL
jgi:hypothetical protein